MSVGSSTAFRSRSATIAASSEPSTPSSRIANSSPPNRATVSAGRTTPSSRPATSLRIASPAGCPRLSLTVLKSSRSTNITQISDAHAHGRAESVLHAVGEERAVGEVGDRIVEGLMGELLLERLPLADVAAVQDDPTYVLVLAGVACAAPRIGASGRPDGAASTRTCASPGRALAPATTCVSRARSACESNLSKRAPWISSTRVAEQTLDRRALIGDDAVGVEHRDQVARVCDERAEAGLALLAVQVLGK